MWQRGKQSVEKFGNGGRGKKRRERENRESRTKPKKRNKGSSLSFFVFGFVCSLCFWFGFVFFSLDNRLEGGFNFIMEPTFSLLVSYSTHKVGLIRHHVAS